MHVENAATASYDAFEDHRVADNSSPRLATMPDDNLTRELLGGEYYVFRDAVHNLIAIDDEVEGQMLRSLLRTREMQRLRRIRQNGLASLVYPSMENTRFSHALGTYAVARRVCAALRDRQPNIKHGMPNFLRVTARTSRAFCVAALLHDLGHAPFSHVWEEHVGHGSTPYHERMGLSLVESEETQIGRALTTSNAVDKSEVIAFLKHQHPFRFLVKLLAGHLDVDRLDFMGRDTRSAGVTYGFHELDWIIRSLRFARLPDSRPAGAPPWVVALDGRKGDATLTQFLYARANMYRMVYLHKTIRAAGQMLLATLRRVAFLVKNDKGVGPCGLGPASLLRFITDPDGSSAEDLAQVDDSDIWIALKGWAGHADGVLQRLSKRLLKRDLFKVFEVNKQTFEHLRTLDMPTSGNHLARIVAGRVGAHIDEAPYYYRLDACGFDVVGKDDDGSPSVWILMSTPLGPQFTPLREFWRDRIGTPEREERYLVICHPRALDNLRLLAENVALARPYEVSLGHDDLPPNYSVIGSLGASGASKDAFVGSSNNPSSDGEHVVALKKYHGEENVARDTSPMLMMGRHQSVSLPRLFESKNGKHWLAEPLWTAALSDLVKRRGPLRDLRELFNIAEQLFDALAFVHQNGIRHTDVKPDNCGVVLSGRQPALYLLGDFGCHSTRIDRMPASVWSKGTIKTRAPEVFRGTIGLPSDVWAMGATFYWLCTERYPFFDSKAPVGNQGDEQRRAVEEDITKNLDTLVPKFVDGFAKGIPPCLGRPLCNCFVDFNRRATASSVRDAVRAGRIAWEQLKTDAGDSARWAWQRSEDVLRAARDERCASLKSEIVGEAKALVDEFNEYIPSSICNLLREQVA